MLIKPYGPLILHEVISEDFLKFLVEASIETKKKSEQDASKNALIYFGLLN